MKTKPDIPWATFFSSVCWLSKLMFDFLARVCRSSSSSSFPSFSLDDFALCSASAFTCKNGICLTQVLEWIHVYFKYLSNSAKFGNFLFLSFFDRNIRNVVVILRQTDVQFLFFRTFPVPLQNVFSWENWSTILWVFFLFYLHTGIGWIWIHIFKMNKFFTLLLLKNKCRKSKRFVMKVFRFVIRHCQVVFYRLQSAGWPKGILNNHEFLHNNKSWSHWDRTDWNWAESYILLHYILFPYLPNCPNVMPHEE